MTKTLHVIAPFFIAEEGDILEFDPNRKVYTLEKKEEFYKVANDSSSEVKSSYSTSFEISEDYAKELIDEGFIEEPVEKKSESKAFVNVFDEINGLIDKYSTELANVDKDTKGQPEVVKLEKTTVLSNLITVLTYLKNLKK